MNWVSVCIVLAFMCGCTEEKDLYQPEETPDYVGSEPCTLNFSTTQDVTLDFNYDVAKGFISVYDLYTENPFNEDGSRRDDLTPIAGGIYSAGSGTVARVIPSHVKELYLFTTSMFVPVLSHATIQGGVAQFSQVNLPAPGRSDSSDTRTIGDRKIDKEVRPVSDFRIVPSPMWHMYDLINPDVKKDIPAEVLTAFSQAFPDSKKTDPKFYRDATFEIINDNNGQGAKVYVSVIYTNAIFNNSLSYFTYKGDKAFKDFTTTEKNNLKVINLFKYADVYNNAHTDKKRGLTPGNYIQLLYCDENGNYSETFPKGSKIGWILHSDAMTGSLTAPLNLKNNWFYSTPEWNTSDLHGTNRTIFFTTKDSNGESFNCFGFEDTFDGDGDCNDVLFHVLTDPADAVVPPPSIDPEVIEDIEKSENKKGVLAFEDNWPEQGDYDLNDVVVKYNSTITYLDKVSVGQVSVKKVVDQFSLIHTGALYNNAFSYKVDIPLTSLKSVTIDGKAYTPVRDGNGFIIELCPNVKAVIPAMQFGVTPKNYTVEMEFVEGAVKESDFVTRTAPYNPFISPAEFPGVEVHLPMYPPTTRANSSLFGTKDDRSNPANQLWYVSGENNKYPFAIHLSDAYDNFVVPAESEKIYITYPQYTNWVNSGMTTNKDWYLHPSK